MVVCKNFKEVERLKEKELSLHSPSVLITSEVIFQLQFDDFSLQWKDQDRTTAYLCPERSVLVGKWFYVIFLGITCLYLFMRQRSSQYLLDALMGIMSQWLNLMVAVDQVINWLDLYPGSRTI